MNDQRANDGLTDASHTTEPDFEALSHQVYRLCLGLLRAPEEAQDAMQEAMLRAWMRREARRADVSWWTWCGGFAVRVCREHQRQWRRNRVFPEGNDLDRVAGTARHATSMPASALEASGASVSARLGEAVERLPGRQREVTVLRFFLGLSTEQTAEILGCPTGTVKSNLHKAISRLHTSMSHMLESHELPRV